MSSLNKAILDLENWISANGWRGYDPYDIKGTRLYLLLNKKNFFQKSILNFINIIQDLAPYYTRKIFNIKPKINAKAMGLFMAAYLKLYLISDVTEYLNKALSCANWLLEHPSKGYAGICWGYPFDWQSVIFIPKNTPSGVVTSIIGEGFWLLYKITNDVKYLDVCKDICIFFVNNLKKNYISIDKLCFSYTPIDNYMVHNANLFVAEFLAKIGREINRTSWIETALKCGNFALADQNPDGSLCYWGRSQQNSHSKGLCHIDHYHTGFEIRKLYGLWKITENKKFKNAYIAYFDFYKKNFIGDNGGLPKMTPNNQYPVNIHSCAEAILLNSILSLDHEECIDLAKNFFFWTMRNMQMRQGEYRYIIKKTKFGYLKINIPYIRWNQAWMFRALIEFKYSLTILKKNYD